jgi:glycosyltransferase involved in cell wall biosynthesis/tetratricopeptide (TPR) repeat protein
MKSFPLSEVPQMVLTPAFLKAEAGKARLKEEAMHPVQKTAPKVQSADENQSEDSEPCRLTPESFPHFTYHVRPAAPKISIVTPSYNQRDFLEECIESILSQDYPNLEYIIMDGGSTDGSVEIIKKYERFLTYWRSAPDAGQYAAINEGFRMATGDIMTWLNSDDKHHSDSLFKAAFILERFPSVEWITGRPTAWNEEGELVLVFDELPLWARQKYLNKFFKKICIQQESTFWRATLWRKAGAYLRTDLQFAGDLELWIRLFRHAQLYTVDTLFGGYRYQPNQKTNLFMNKYIEEGERIIDQEIENIQRGVFPVLLSAPPPISFDECSFNDYRQSVSPMPQGVDIPIKATSIVPRTTRRAPVMIATSIAPREIEKQKRAIQSWIESGFNVVSVNCEEEIEIAREAFPEVHFLRAKRNARESLGKPFIYLDDLLAPLKNADSEICGIVNSDIHLMQDKGFISFIHKEASDSLVYIPRVDVNSLEALEGEVYDRGFDVFFFPQSWVSCFPESDFCLGAPWWDYWVPLNLSLKGCLLKRLISPVAFHLKHPCAFTSEQWMLYGKKLSAYLHENLVQTSGLNSSSEPWSKFLIDFSSYIHFHLSDLAKHREEEAQLTFRYCQCLARHILGYLESNSMPLKYQGHDKPWDIPDHLRVQLVNEAILQVRQFMNEGQFEKALNRLDLALERFPHATDLIALRSGLGRNIEAGSENHTWHDTSNGNIQSLECRVIDAPKGQKTEAERLNRQGEALVAAARIEDAWGKFTQALKHDPDYAPAHNNLGVLHWQKGDVQAALDRLLTAVEIDPNDRDTILNCGEVLRSLDRIEHAKGIYSSYLERNPHDEEIGKQLSVLEAEASTGLMPYSPRSPKIVLYALRELHLPVLLPIYRELIKRKVGQVGFMAPPFQVSPGGPYQEGLSEETITCLREDNIPFWGHEKTERYACVVTADFCYDRVDGWGPIVCVGHGTISKGIYFTSTPRSRIENYATVLCVPGPWHKDSFGDQVFTRIEPTGFSKMDELHRLQPSDKGGIIQSIGFSPDKTTILFAPTYNPELTSMGMLFEEWKNLDPDKYQVIFKLHGAAEAEWTERYERLAASQQNFHYAPESSIMAYMHACDVLVSDVSSAYVEFLVLDKPIILVNNPEMGRYPGFHPDNIEYQVRDAAYQIDHAGELHKILQQLEAEDPRSKKREEYAAKLFPPPDGQSSRRIAAQIMSVVRGEITLRPPPGRHGRRVYIPTRIRCFRQIEENIERAQFPVELFSHKADMKEIGGLPVHHLGEDEVPPPPFICMTGEFVLPKQWDYLWLLMEHFTDVRGLFGPVLPDGHENLDQQHSLIRGKPPDLSEEHLQSVYKFYLCNVESIRPVKTLKADGLIVTEGIDHDLLKAWLHSVHDPTEAAHFADEVRRLGHSVGVLESYYGYSKHEVDTGRLEAPKDGILAVYHSEKQVDDRVSEPAFERSPSRTEAGGYLVSAIVSTYNAGQFIRGCLEDLEAQTISDRLEIVVVDSASEQNEGEIVREFQQKYPNIKYIRTDRRESIYAAWNRGIRASSGKYITNANTDDRHRKDAFETLSGVLDARDDIAVVYGNQLITQVPNQTFDTVTPSGKFEWPEFDRETLLEYCCVGPQPMWRRSIHDEGHIYFDESLEVVGDYEFWLNVSQRYRLKRIDDFLGVYYRSPENHNREFTDLHQSRTESFDVRRKYYLKTVESLPPEVLKSRITDISRRIERCLSDVGAGELSKEAKRHLEHLFWRVCVLFELYGDIDNSRKIARRYFDMTNDGFMLAFHLKEVAQKTAPEKDVDTGPLVSVIIPTFHSEKHITETIHSVLNQTYKNYEVLIVDDGSQDETLAIMKGLRDKNPGKITKILEQENRGPSAARNRGIAEARGELILALDADDQISYDYLEKAVSEFQRDPSIDVVFTEAVFYGHKNKIWALKDVSLPDLFMRNQVNVTALFRKRCWARVSGYDENLPGYEDWDLWIRLAKEKYKFFRIPEPLFFYRHKRRSRGYLSAQKDVGKKIAIMRKHPDIYRFPAQEEISMLHQFQLIPQQFLEWKQEEKIKLPEVGRNERTAKGKILFVVHDFPPYRSAGAQLFAKNLAQEINSRGIVEVDILHPVFREAYPEKYVISEKEYEGLRVFELTKEQSLEPQKIFHQGVANAFQRFLQTHQYDLIHFHGLGQLSLSPVHVARMMGLKTAMTLHDYWFLCDHWHLIRKNQGLCSGPESVEKCANCYLEDHSLEKTADNMGAATNYHSFRKQSFRETFSLLNKVFAPSQYTRDFFKKYGLDGVERNPNGIDYTPKQHELRRRDDQPLVFGYAGQIIKRKGVNLLIEAFKQMPDPDIRLHLWGKINEKYKYGRNIRELIRSDERITWFGEYTPQQLESIFEAVDVAVVPSLMDNYPIILQEAFVHKTPVIASKTGGIPELVSHEHNGLLTEPGSVDDLREKMKAIVQKPELIEELRANIPPQKTLQEDAEFYLETYRALLNDGEKKVPGERVTVQFYVLKSVHWPMFQNLYYFLKDRTDVEEIIICLPDLSFIGNGLAEKLLSLDATFVSDPRAKRVDVTFIADTIAGKVKGCGKIVNVGHGTISKGFYFTDSPWTEREDWVDLLCVPGAYAREKFDRILTTKVAATGMPKLDPVFSGKYDREHLCRLLNLDPDKRIILYAPTFNQDLSSVSVFAERFAELAKADRYILIKLHGSTAPDQTTKYQQLAERHENIVFIHEPNIAPYIGGADVMISDVSSAYMEFMALDKPVILYNNPNCQRYHGYDPKDIEYQWRDLGTQVASFDELKVQLEESIQFGDDRSAIRMGYARELFADLEGNASARVWNETKEVLRSHDRLINIPTISIVVVITDDNLFAIRAQVHNLQFYSVMPLELILVNQSQSREIRDFIETTRRYGQFVNVMTVEIGQAVNKDDAGLAGMKKATGDFVIYLQDHVILYKNFDYIAYKTFKWNPEVEALTGVSNLPVKEIHFETYIQRGAEVSFSRFAYDFINRYQAKEIADLSLSFLPPFLAFRRGAFALEPCSDFEEFKTQISENQNLKLCLSLFYSTLNGRDLKLIKDFWSTRFQMPQKSRIDLMLKLLPNYGYPEIAELLLDDMLAMGTPKKDLLGIVARSFFARFYDVPYKSKIIKLFGEFNDLAEMLRREIDLIEKVSTSSKDLTIKREALRGHKTADVPKRVLFYFFKNVHIPILIPIYQAMKRLHPEAAVGFGYMHHAPQMRAGFTTEELRLLESYGEGLYDVPQRFKPDITFIADSVYPWTQNCGKLVNVGHGVLSKGQYYTDTLIARREEQADLVCVPGIHHERIVREVISRPVATTGMAKLDGLFSGRVNRASVAQKFGLPQNHDRFVLFAPTFNDELSSIPFVLDRINEVITDDQTWLVIKLHGSTEESYRAMYRQLSERDQRVIYAKHLDISPFLALCDVMVSDVSSAMMEFAALDKPLVLFNNPNWHTYPNYNPKDIEFLWRDIGIQVHDLNEMKEAVKESFGSSGTYSEKRRFYTDQLFANKYDGKASVRIIEHAFSSPYDPNE